MMLMDSLGVWIGAVHESRILGKGKVMKMVSWIVVRISVTWNADCMDCTSCRSYWEENW